MIRATNQRIDSVSRFLLSIKTPMAIHMICDATRSPMGSQRSDERHQKKTVHSFRAKTCIHVIQVFIAYFSFSISIIYTRIL